MAGTRSWIQLPEGWEREARRGPWPFVTRERLVRPDGTPVLWSSRAHRKRGVGPVVGSTWWAPRARGWWIGVLFAIGSSCFALGSFGPYSVAVGTTVDGVTFFVGSIFFTSAAFLQFREAVDAAAGPVEAGEDPRHPRSWRVLGWAPWRIDWWATSVQFAGTLFFNVSTFAALRGLDVLQAERRVWAPDVVGSIAFLVASALAWAEAGHAWWSWRPRSVGWQIAALNLAGSIAFGVSAVGAYIVKDDGDLLSATVANAGTFVGAVCFLAGGVLLLPERTSGPATEDD